MDSFTLPDVEPVVLRDPPRRFDTALCICIALVSFALGGAAVLWTVDFPSHPLRCGFHLSAEER